MRTVRVFGRSRTAASPTIIRCRKFRTAPNRSRARQKTVTADLPVAYVPASMSAITLVSENLHSPPRSPAAGQELRSENATGRFAQQPLPIRNGKNNPTPPSPPTCFQPKFRICGFYRSPTGKPAERCPPVASFCKCMKRSLSDNSYMPFFISYPLQKHARIRFRRPCSQLSAGNPRRLVPEKPSCRSTTVCSSRAPNASAERPMQRQRFPPHAARTTGMRRFRPRPNRRHTGHNIKNGTVPPARSHRTSHAVSHQHGHGAPPERTALTEGVWHPGLCFGLSFPSGTRIRCGTLPKRLQRLVFATQCAYFGDEGQEALFR